MSPDRIPVVAADGHRHVVEAHAVDDAPAVVLVLPAMGVAAAYYEPVVALGHSLGGQIACPHAAAHPGGLAGIARIASCTIHYSGWPFPYNIELLVRTQITRPVVALLAYFPGKMLGFAGSEGKQQMLDWANSALHGRYVIPTALSTSSRCWAMWRSRFWQ